MNVSRDVLLEISKYCGRVEILELSLTSRKLRNIFKNKIYVYRIENYFNSYANWIELTRGKHENHHVIYMLINYKNNKNFIYGDYYDAHKNKFFDLEILKLVNFKDSEYRLAIAVKTCGPEIINYADVITHPNPKFFGYWMNLSRKDETEQEIVEQCKLLLTWGYLKEEYVPDNEGNWNESNICEFVLATIFKHYFPERLKSLFNGFIDGRSMTTDRFYIINKLNCLEIFKDKLHPGLIRDAKETADREFKVILGDGYKLTLRFGKCTVKFYDDRLYWLRHVTAFSPEANEFKEYCKEFLAGDPPGGQRSLEDAAVTFLKAYPYFSNYHRFYSRYILISERAFPGKLGEFLENLDKFIALHGNGRDIKPFISMVLKKYPQYKDKLFDWSIETWNYKLFKYLYDSKRVKIYRILSLLTNRDLIMWQDLKMLKVLAKNRYPGLLEQMQSSNLPLIFIKWVEINL